MAIHDNPFYFKTIRNTTAAVGSLFNNIGIVRSDANGTPLKTFRVPIEYGSMEHWYTKIVKGTTQGDVTHNPASLPMISYLFNDVQYDADRQTNNKNKIKFDVETVDGEEIRKWQYAGTPVKMSFTVSIMTKYLDDALQIIEQILPYFDPHVNLKIKNVQDTLAINDVKVKLAGPPQMSDNYDEGFDKPRLIVWELQLEADTFLYKPVQTQKVIRTVIVDIDNMDPLYDIETITVAANPGENEDKDNSTVTIDVEVGS